MNLSRNVEPIRVYLLGAFRLERDSQTIQFPTHKVESLFAYLALHPEQHLREKLAALLWGDSTDEQARHSLRTALATIRKELGDDALLADRESIQLNPNFPLWVDAREFPFALELYQGDLLTDFYDDWIPPEREYLRKIYLDALLQLAQQHRANSEYTRAIEFAHKVLATDPANEHAYQHIMFCLAATGDRIGALKEYDECEKRLRDELGVAPSQETLALRDQIEQALTGGKAREALFTNVPVPLTRFIGRENEIAQVTELFARTRLLTLTGSGGCGKTRLAVQVATDMANKNRFKDGVWWVELAALTDPALVPQAVASVFYLRESSQVSTLTAITNYLRAKELLLVFDNCEHLIDACARLADALLQACSQLKILASSREALGIVGEAPYRIPSLSLPPQPSCRDRQVISQSEAVQLFLDRATALEPLFVLTQDNAPTIAQICERLDGIPLAIELAAARVKMLSVEQIAARLDNRFRLLTGGSRTALARQQTLRGAIDWSHSLLTDAERVLLRRLSVFAGGWTLEAAQAVCGEPAGADDVLDRLARLVDKSLIIVEQQAQQARYRMLETIRQYACEKLLDSDEGEQVRARHLAFFLQLAEELAPKLQSAEAKRCMDRLEIEYGNLRAAWEHAFASDDELSLRLALALRWFWTRRGYLIEGREWMTRLLPRIEAGGTTIQRARALILVGALDFHLSDYTSARSLYEQGLAIARSLGDRNAIADALAGLGRSYQMLNASRQARPLFEESLALYKSLDNPVRVASVLHGLGSAVAEQGDIALAQALEKESVALCRAQGNDYLLVSPLTILGEIERAQGNYDRAAALYTECVEIDRKVGHEVHLANALINLSMAVLQQGDHLRAKGLYIESLDWLRRRGARSFFTMWLTGMAGVVEASGRPSQAARLLGAVNSLVQSSGGSQVSGSLADRQLHQNVLDQVRAELDPPAFDQAWKEGCAMTLEQAIEYALENVK